MLAGWALKVLMAALCLRAQAALPAQTEPFPSHPVRVIVPFPTLSRVDLVMRVINQRLPETMGQPVVIDNRPGASGAIGTDLVARSAPDGHTLLATTLPLVVNPSLLGNLQHDVLRDFAPVSLLATAPFVLAVYPALPVSSVREFIAYARVRPGELNYASAGNGSNAHIAAELFKNLARLDIMHVPYKAGGPAFAALLGGETQVSFIGVAAAAQHVKTGRLRALGITANRRSALLPQVPAIAESGLPGYEFTSWYGVLVRRATRADRVVALNGYFRNVLQAPDMAERFSHEGVEIVASTPEAFGRHLRAELARWARVVREGGLRAE